MMSQARRTSNPQEEAPTQGFLNRLARETRCPHRTKESLLRHCSPLGGTALSILCPGPNGTTKSTDRWVRRSSTIGPPGVHPIAFTRCSLGFI